MPIYFDDLINDNELYISIRDIVSKARVKFVTHLKEFERKLEYWDKELSNFSRDGDYNHTVVTTNIGFRIYECKLEILMIDCIINKNRRGFFLIIARIKDTAHKFLESFREFTNQGFYTEQDYLEACDASLKQYNRMSETFSDFKCLV